MALKKIIIIIAVISLIFILLIIFGQRYFQQRQQYSFNTNQAAVVKELKELNRLETASYTIEKIIESQSEQGGRLRELLYGDRILFIAHGQAVAGFNLGVLTENDVRVESQNLTLNLPKAEILYTRLDNEKSRVYDRQTGLFTRGDQNLEAQTRQVAEEEIRKAACQANILDQASENAKKQLAALFKTFQFENVTINTQPTACN